jgi:hypothetical protein
MLSNKQKMDLLMESLESVDEMRRGADGRLRGQLFSFDKDLQKYAERFKAAVYSLLNSGEQVNQEFKSVGIDLDKISRQLQNIPAAGLESSYQPTDTDTDT